MRKIALYARVSTDEQARVEEGSIKNQIESIQRWVQGEQLKSDGRYGQVIDEYIDDGYSAKNLQRPEVMRLLQDIARSKVDTVIMTEVSRLSRSVRDWIDLRSFFDNHKISFITLRQNFDTSNAMGRAMLSFAIEFAQLEREQTAERVKFSAHARKSRGLWTGGPIPFGLRATDRPGFLEVDEVRKLFALRIFDTFLNKAGSLARTVDIINAEGLLHDRSTPWTASGLTNWVKSYALVGKVPLNLKNKDLDQHKLKESDRFQLIDSVWEPVIPYETWLEANELLEQNYRRLKTSQWKGYEYLFTGLFECTAGRHFTGTSGNSSNGKKIAYYRHAKSEGDTCPCGTPTVRAKDAEVKVLTALTKLAKNPDLVTSLVEQANQEFLSRKPDFDLVLRAALEKNTEVLSKLESVTDMVLAASSAAERHMWLEKSRRLQEEKDRIERQIDQISHEKENFHHQLLNAGSIQQGLQPFESNFHALPLASKQRILRSMLEKITVEKDRLVLNIKEVSSGLGSLREAKNQCISPGQVFDHKRAWLLRTGSNRRPGD